VAGVLLLPAAPCPPGGGEGTATVSEHRHHRINHLTGEFIHSKML